MATVLSADKGSGPPPDCSVDEIIESHFSAPFSKFSEMLHYDLLTVVTASKGLGYNVALLLLPDKIELLYRGAYGKSPWNGNVAAVWKSIEHMGIVALCTADKRSSYEAESSGLLMQVLRINLPFSAHSVLNSIPPRERYIALPREDHGFKEINSNVPIIKDNPCDEALALPLRPIGFEKPRGFLVVSNPYNHCSVHNNAQRLADYWYGPAMHFMDDAAFYYSFPKTAKQAFRRFLRLDEAAS